MVLSLRSVLAAATVAAFIAIHPSGAQEDAGVPSRSGMVVCTSAPACDAGSAMLARGGNAVDAAVATAFALAVTHASAGNIGGGGFMLVRPPGAAAETIAIDFRETAPTALTRAGFDKMQAGGAKGGAAAGVPGSVAGLLLAHERFGRLKREELLGPAIALAKGGMILGRRQADLLRGSYASIKQDRTLEKRFGDAAGPKAQGARVVQPELASALERIQQDGAAGFYE